MEERKSQILYGINEEAAKYYYDMLRSDEGEEGIACLKKLGLTEETIDRFRLGYIEEGIREFVNHLKDKGYSGDQIIEAGFIIDRFQNRIMIPIIDDEYRVIGFCGRVVDDSMPRYLVYPETMVFDYSNSLFGLDHVKDSAAQYIILCQGYMDVITLHQAGFDMAVAPAGVRFTPEHAKKIKQYARDVIICYHSNRYGRNATSNASDILNEAGINVKKMELTPHLDPHEYITKEGGTAFGELLRAIMK